MHGAGYVDGHGHEGDKQDEDAQDHRRPAERQARERQASPLFSGALDLVPGHVAEHDGRDGRHRPDYELRERADDTRYGEPVGPATGGTTAARGTGRSVTIWSRSA